MMKAGAAQIIGATILTATRTSRNGRTDFSLAHCGGASD
jgi:hypothetical protein